MNHRIYQYEPSYRLVIREKASSTEDGKPGKPFSFDGDTTYKALRAARGAATRRNKETPGSRYEVVVVGVLHTEVQTDVVVP